jgi:hypothetical protein
MKNIKTIKNYYKLPEERGRVNFLRSVHIKYILFKGNVQYNFIALLIAFHYTVTLQFISDCVIIYETIY